MTTLPPDATPRRGRAALFRSATFLEHDPGDHPENAGRLAAIDDTLDRQNLLPDRPAIPFTQASDDELKRVHDPRYIAGAREFAARGGGWLDADTAVGLNSVDIAPPAAGGAIAPVGATLDGQAARGFVVGSPPGDHGPPARGMGFCIFKTVSAAAAHALSHGGDRMLIDDWDVGHGDGAQDAFYAADRLLFCA